MRSLSPAGVFVLLLGIVAFEASASRLDEIGERIEQMGASLADAFHTACLRGALRDGALQADDLLREMRETAAARGRLKARCQGAYDAWRVAAARLDERGDFDEVERRQRELLPCWDEIESLQAEVKAEARRCLAIVRPEPLFPFGLGELDTRVDLADGIHCPRRNLCRLRPEAISARDPAWIGPGTEQVVLGLSDVGIEQVLTSVLSVHAMPHCAAARDRVQAWTERIEAAWPEVVWHGELGTRCEEGSRMAVIGDHVVVLMLSEERARSLAAALVVHLPWRILREGEISP